MPESQATPQETQPQVTSEPQAQQEPRQSQQPVQRKSLEDNPQQAQRAEQLRHRAKVERKNPFSPDNREARRAEAMKALRQERGVAEPRQQEATNEQVGTPPSGSNAASGNSEHADKPSDAAAPKADVKADETPEWYRRKEELAAAEKRASEASANAERQRAEVEKAKADAEAAVQRMAAAKEDPVQFLSEVGMSKEEWDNFLANGGKMTPEQKKLREMTQNLEKMQQRVEEAERKAAEREIQARYAAEESAFSSQLQELTYVPQMGGMAAVRQRQALLAQKTGQPVGLKDAAEHLEQEMRTGLERILQNPKIRSSLKLDVNTSHAGQAAETPRTLSNRVSSESSHTEAKPHPLDWAAKRKLYEQRVQQAQSARTNR